MPFVRDACGKQANANNRKNDCETETAGGADGAVDLEAEGVAEFLGAGGDVAGDFGAELFDLAPGAIEGVGGAAEFLDVAFARG